jgi:O-antigen ligase
MSSDRALLSTLGMLGVALAVADGVRTRRGLDRLLGGLAVGGAFMACVAIAQSLLGFDLTSRLVLPPLVLNGDLVGISARGVVRVAGTAAHYIELGVVLAMLTPIAVHFALTSYKRSSRRFWAAAAGLIALAALLSVSRSAIVSMVVGMLVLLPAWSWRGRISALVVGVGFLALVSLVQPGLLGTLRSLFGSLDTDPSVESRTSDYAIVSGFVSERPLLGRGPGTFLPEKYLFLDNQVLGSVLEIGFLGLAALLVIIGTGFALARRVGRYADRHRDRHLGRAISAAIAAGAVSMVTFDALGFGTFAISFFLLIGASGAAWRLTHRPSSAQSLPLPAEPRIVSDAELPTPSPDYTRNLEVTH